MRYHAVWQYCLVFFFILLYELSVDPREQIEGIKQFIIRFFLKLEPHRLYFCLFPSKRVSSGNVGCCIINGVICLYSLEDIYFTFPYHFWLLEKKNSSLWSYAQFSWPQIKGIFSWIWICLMKPGSCVLHLFGLKILYKNRICCHGLPFPNYSYFVLSMIIICMKKRYMLHIHYTLGIGVLMGCRFLHF